MAKTNILPKIDGLELSTINYLLMLGSCYFLLKGIGSSSISVPLLIEEIFFICILAETIFFLQDIYNEKLTSMFRNFFLRMGVILSICCIVILALLVFGVSFGAIQSVINDVRINYVALMLFLLTIANKPAYEKLSGLFSPMQRILIIGSGEIAFSLLNETKKFPSSKYQIAGVVPDKDIIHHCVPTELFLDDGKELSAFIKENKINKILTASVNQRGLFPVEELLSRKLHRIDVIDIHDFYEEITGKIHIQDIRPSWLIMAPRSKRRKAKSDFWRTAVSSFLALLGLILTSPLMLIIAIMIKLDSKGPIFFKQKRVGKLGQPFVLFKFRTMNDNAEFKTGPIWAQENDVRVTRVGRLIRKMRFDELPQLINVLKGEMNFIGPRPERPYFVNKLKDIIPYYNDRHIIKPGITGWAAVKYQYGATIEDAIEKLQYDFYYIKHSSLLLDLLIVVLTFKVMLTGKGSR